MLICTPPSFEWLRQIPQTEFAKDWCTNDRHEYQSCECHYDTNTHKILVKTVLSYQEFIVNMPSGGYGQKLPRPTTPPGVPPPEAHRVLSKLSYGVVCSSNINRSMEAHLVLGNAGMKDVILK